MPATGEADLHPARPARHHCDVLVIGGGPSGAATAYWLAEAGVDVLVVEKKHFPREKTCGDGLTPRSVRQLYDMGLGDDLEGRHKFFGLRALAFGRELTMPWPTHRDFPDHGYVITRAELDALVSGRAEKAGAVVWQGAEALEPLGADASNGGAATGAIVADRDHGTTSEVHARVVVVADGSNSRFGRALGAQRDRDIPQGLALRGYYYSPRHDESYIESQLDLRDKNGEVMPGYGWIFPLGDGRVNVGVGLLSSGAHTGVNTTKLMSTFVETAPASWCLSPETLCAPPTGGRLPMGLSVGPRVGPDYLLVGDAAGSINPFNGEGIAYGYETGRIAAATVAQALAASDLAQLREYESALQASYGTYYKVASAFMKLMERPRLLRGLIGVGMRAQPIMEVILRIMTNLMRDDVNGAAEIAYSGAAALARIAA